MLYTWSEVPLSYIYSYMVSFESSQMGPNPAKKGRYKRTIVSPNSGLISPPKNGMGVKKFPMKKWGRGGWQGGPRGFGKLPNFYRFFYATFPKEERVISLQFAATFSKVKPPMAPKKFFIPCSLCVGQPTDPGKCLKKEV